MNVLDQLKEKANEALRRYQDAPAEQKDRRLEEYRRAYATFTRQRMIVHGTPRERERSRAYG